MFLEVRRHQKSRNSTSVAIGSDVDLAHSSIRFGLGRFTTEEEVDYTADKLVHHVNRLRDLSPLWDMLQEGIDLKSIQWGAHH